MPPASRPWRQVREVVHRRRPTAGRQLGVIADCPTLVAVLSAPDLACGPGLVHLGPGGTPVTEATVQTALFLGGSGRRNAPIGEATARVSGGAVDRYAPAASRPRRASRCPR